MVLVTDRYETIRSVLDRLRAQTVREQLEVVLVCPREDEFAGRAELDDFAAARVIVGDPASLGEARADGVRAASAPLVFIGETHSFPHPGMAEELIRAHADGWAQVVPGFGNANPHALTSWAGFLSDYGAWVPEIPAGEIRFAPGYNSSYRRSVLLEFGDRLGSALRGGDELANGLRERNHQTLFAPAARIDHLNVSRISAWFRERFLAGRVIGEARARRWPWRLRLLYLFATPLLPPLYLWRVRQGVAASRRAGKMPAAALPLLPVCALTKAAGEMSGYLHPRAETAHDPMVEFELHRSSYVSSGPR